MYIIGQDVSFYQDNKDTPIHIDFTKMVNSGSSFTIIRAGQNLWVDRDIELNMKNAKAAGIPRGTYWFYDSRVDPKVQARLYIQSLKGDLGELPLFADLEERYGGKYSGWRNWKLFLEELKSLCGGHEISIYTAPYYWKENTSILKGCTPTSLEYFHQYSLWIANYEVDAPSIPKPWSPDEWVFWQFTDKGNGPLYGVESLNVDMNYFNGNIDEFRTRFNLGEIVTPPLEEVYPVEMVVMMSNGSTYNGKLTKT